MHFSKQKILILSIAIILFFSVAFFADAFHARKLEINYPELPGIPKLESHTSLPNLIKYIFVFTVTISGIIALGALVYAGFLFLMSGANPGLRATAKKKIADVLWGLLLLLGAYIFFNTLNPDLTILRTPGLALAPTSQPSIKEPLGILDTGVDTESLKYGGVVVYGSISLGGDKGGGSVGSSQVLLNNVTQFDEETWLGAEPKYIKILGTCKVSLSSDENYTGPSTTLTGPFAMPLEVVTNKSLRFDDRSCLGSSITAYFKTGYHRNSWPFIYSDGDLKEDRLMGLGGGNPKVVTAEDNIESVRFNRPDLSDFKIKFCEKKQAGEKCADVEQANLDEATPATTLGGIKDWAPAFDFLKNDISSFVFSGKKSRQAGVVLYNKDDFSGLSEIFINSDKNLEEDPENWEKSNAISLGGEYTSSIRIVGEYIVTLFDCINFCQDEAETPNKGHFLRIYNNTQVPMVDQGHIETFLDPLFPVFNPSTELGGIGNREGDVLQISKLSAFTHPGKDDATQDDDKTWNDYKVKSITIHVPKRIYDAQQLWMIPCGDSASDSDTTLCLLAQGDEDALPPPAPAPAPAPAPIVSCCVDGVTGQDFGLASGKKVHGCNNLAPYAAPDSSWCVAGCHVGDVVSDTGLSAVLAATASNVGTRWIKMGGNPGDRLGWGPTDGSPTDCWGTPGPCVFTLTETLRPVHSAASLRNDFLSGSSVLSAFGGALNPTLSTSAICVED